MKSLLPVTLCLAAVVTACNSGARHGGDSCHHRVAVIDPGHFHAALVTKSPLANVSDTISVYAPSGAELEQYKAFIESYNTRADNPTSWVLDVAETPDFMAAFNIGSDADIIVLAGNNRYKTDYLLAATRAGKNVLADKPMAIDTIGFDKLVNAYSMAADSGRVIYELMTERYDTINILTRELINDTALFGHLLSDSDEPAVTMKSVHHFYKEVSGTPLKRPAWYYDVKQQGEGIADVTTHLLDLVMWQCFPDSVIDYTTDVELVDALHSATVITPEQFLSSTGQKIDTPLEVFSNGTILVRIKDILVRIDVQWNFEAPSGSGDTFTATYRGTRGTIEIAQDAATGFVKQLASIDSAGTRHEYDIPVAERLGHEEHFNRVTESFLRHLDGEPLPAWESANTLAKYYITTQAVARANARVL